MSDERAPRPLRGALEASRGAKPGLAPLVTSPILLTGLYVWAITAAPAISMVVAQTLTRGASARGLGVVAAAACAVLALLLGAALERRGNAAAPLAGVWGFVAMLLVSWALVPASVDAARIDPLRGALGAIGFALFAMSWGVPDVFRRPAPEDDPRADLSTSLGPREVLPFTAVALVAATVVTCLGACVLAWHVREAARGVLAQSLFGLGAVVLVSTAAEIATARRHGLTPPGRRLRGALVSLGLFALVVVSSALLSRR